MKKSILTAFLLVVAIVLLNNHFSMPAKSQTMMANPWTDCEADFSCANKVSGITFPLRLSNYWIRAMKGMIEISYPFDEFRHVTVRKTEKFISDDISGVYTKYPKNKTEKLPNGVFVKIRAKGNKIYVMNFSASTGYYSAYCEQGMSMREATGVYEVIKEAEQPKQTVKNKYSFCELGDLVGDDVKRIKYHNYNLDYHKKDFSKKQILKLADECLYEGVGSQYEMDCCLTMKMYPENK